MTLIVQSERWCEMAMAGLEQGNCTQCQAPALIVCEGCGMAVCDVHEAVCRQCGRSYCTQCKHACVAGQPLRKAA